MEKYWTKEIIVDYKIAFNKNYAWSAKCKWQSDNGKGVIETKEYKSSVTEAINCILENLQDFGIELLAEIGRGKANYSLFVRGNDLPEEVKQKIKDKFTKDGWYVLFV